MTGIKKLSKAKKKLKRDGPAVGKPLVKAAEQLVAESKAKVEALEVKIGPLLEQKSKMEEEGAAAIHQARQAVEEAEDDVARLETELDQQSRRLAASTGVAKAQTELEKAEDAAKEAATRLEEAQKAAADPEAAMKAAEFAVGDAETAVEVCKCASSSPPWLLASRFVGILWVFP